MSTRNFRQMLEARWACDNFVCVGLDSEFEKIPEHLKSVPDFRRDSYLTTVASFNRDIVTATRDLACAFKPNSAFYEAFGSSGIETLDRTIQDIRALAPNVPVILDAKRADIGKTNTKYVQFGFDYLQADAITVHPYLGAEALSAFLSLPDKGVIVLCRTSNPGAGEFQDLPVALTFGELVDLVGDADEANTLNGIMNWSRATGGYRMPMYQYVALRISRHWNKNSNCALVVGATYPDELRQVRILVGDMPILIPGIGSQGGDLKETVLAGKDSHGQGMIINSSSAIIFASNDVDFAEAARREAKKLRDLINQYRQKGERMTPEELRNHVRRLADSRCNAKHPDYYDSLICVGPGSAHGFGPPCDECIAEVERELEMKQGKAHGRELSPEEAVEVRKKLGL